MDPKEEELARRLTWLRAERNYRRNRGIRVPAWVTQEIRSLEQEMLRREDEGSRPAPIPLALWVAIVALALSSAAAWLLR